VPVADPCTYVLLPTDSIRISANTAIAGAPPTEGEIAACAQTLLRAGEMAHPLTVRPCGEGEWELVDGVLRLLAALYLGWEAVLCRVREFSDEDAVLISVLLDATKRKPPADLQRAWHIQETLTLLGLRPVDFAAISGYSEGEISEARRYARSFPLADVGPIAAQNGIPLEVVARTPRDTLRRLAREADPVARMSGLLASHTGPAAGTLHSQQILEFADGALRLDLQRVRRQPLAGRIRLLLRLLVLLTIGR
jgi:ParB-like chromosome segregation protein Spo0J